MRYIKLLAEIYFDTPFHANGVIILDALLKLSRLFEQRGKLRRLNEKFSARYESLQSSACKRL